jgi:hypothetical protein
MHPRGDVLLFDPLTKKGFEDMFIAFIEWFKCKKIN